MKFGRNGKREKVIARFMAKVVKVRREDGGECWIWQGAKNDNKSEFPYGAFRVNGKKEYAHRVSFALFRGPLREGLEIMHRPYCLSEACVNPADLAQGKHSTNKKKMLDAALLGQLSATES